MLILISKLLKNGSLSLKATLKVYQSLTDHSLYLSTIRKSSSLVDTNILMKRSIFLTLERTNVKVTSSAVEHSNFSTNPMATAPSLSAEITKLWLSYIHRQLENLALSSIQEKWKQAKFRSFPSSIKVSEINWVKKAKFFVKPTHQITSIYKKL